ncbi:MAG: hypothetical protein GX424_09840 [Clostridiales bacterium]|nr:hypothetical protein [Clostridiales bacterium]
MPDFNTDNLVGMLREKTEEADLQQYLKSTFGGYTKNSVREYITILRKQQQATVDTFNSNLQALLEEKETLKASNEKLASRLTKVESQYQNLTEGMLMYNLENKEFSVQDIISLKNKISALESSEKAKDGKIRELNKELERQRYAMQEQGKELQQSKQETRAQKELLVEEKAKTCKQRDLVSQLSGTVEESRNEIKYLREIVSEGKVAELNKRIDELLVNASTQENIIAQRNKELEEKEKSIQTFHSENESLSQNIQSLSATVDKVLAQNVKMAALNKALAARLEETNKQIVSLIREKSDVTVEKMILGKKLDEAGQKISLLELDAKRANKK